MVEWRDIFGPALVLGGICVGGLVWRRARIGPEGYWGWAWVDILASGIALRLAERVPDVALLAFVLGSLFPVLLLAGALRYSGRAVPGWLFPAGVCLGLFRVASSLLGASAVGHAASLLVEPPVLLIAAILVQGTVVREGRSFVHRLIAPGFVVLAGIEGLDAIQDIRGHELSVPWLLWLSAAAPLLAIHLLTTIDLIRQRVVAAGEESQRTSNALADATERFRAMTENASDLIAETDLGGHFLYGSPSYRDILGCEPRELTGSSIFARAHPDDLEAAKRGEEALLAAGHVVVPPLRVRHRDGSWRWVETSARSYTTTDGTSRVVLIGRDVTDQMRTVAALRSSEARFRALADHADDGIAEIDTFGRYLYINSAYERKLGHSLDALRGMVPVDVVHPEDRAKVLEAFHEAVENGGPTSLQYRVRSRDGSTVWIESVGTAYRSSTGEPRGVIVSRDITERIEAEEKRHELEAQMQQARRLESLGVLAGGIAHDFNNLLVGILSNAEMVLEDLDPESPVRLRAEEIKRAGERASELTQQLLAYAGKADVSLETIDLGTLVRELAQLLRASLPKTAKLQVELEEETPWIHADATQVRQVVMNLITNAGDALEGRSGVVTVRAGMMHVDHGDLARCCFAEGLGAGVYAYVEVRDTGRGIEAEQLNHIFDPFFTTKFQGRGLGLAAVAGIVRGHRGAVSVESEPSEGTRVRVFLPRAVGAVDSVGEVSLPSEWRGQGTVLVVDDDQTVRTTAGMLIERSGFSVLRASSGAEAVELFRKSSREVSCVLLDVTMPVMDGEETFWLLREIRADVPVLFMSGHSSRDIDSRLLGKTRVGRLRKPFRRAELEQGLRRVLEESSPESTKTSGA